MLIFWQSTISYIVEKFQQFQTSYYIWYKSFSIYKLSVQRTYLRISRPVNFLHNIFWELLNFLLSFWLWARLAVLQTAFFSSPFVNFHYFCYFYFHYFYFYYFHFRCFHYFRCFRFLFRSVYYRISSDIFIFYSKLCYSIFTFFSLKILWTFAVMERIYFRSGFFSSLSFHF